MLTALIIFPTLAILAALGLVAISTPADRYTLIAPAIRTVALITTITIYVGALFHP